MGKPRPTEKTQIICSNCGFKTKVSSSYFVADSEALMLGATADTLDALHAGKPAKCPECGKKSLKYVTR